ncbi:helix-turn-helix domain-containing protein [Brevibacillus reuszeri]|uniref:helix-turn-helix domain-containing protein n=1 Tax=Brevibacillus reuszeri TaxID=54915 RepID=UPI000CCC27FF|nr:helix-turn-helix domain-containing protein [Brevibacillus reuszeri]
MKRELSHRQLQMLIQVSNAINSTLELDVVFNTIMKETLSVIEAADEGYLFLYDPEEDYLIAKSIFLKSNDILSVVRLKPGESMTGITYLNKKCTLFPDRESVYQATRTMSAINQAKLQAADPIFPYSAACAPIMTNGVCIGVITLDCFHPDKSFQPDDLQLLEAISHQAAVALEKASLYRAREISISLLEEMNVQMNRQNQSLNRSLEIHRHLADLVLHGEGVNAILPYIQQLMGTPILLLDQMGELIASSTKPLTAAEEEKLAQIRNVIHSLPLGCIPRPLPEVSATTNGFSLLPIGARANLLGYLALLTSDPFDEIDKAALEHASTVISFELVKEQAIFETQQNLKGHFIEELFTGKINHQLIDQAKHLQLDANRSYQVLTINLESTQHDSFDLYKRILAVRRNLTQVATELFLQRYPHGLIVTKNDHLVILLSYAQSFSELETQRHLKEQCQLFGEYIQKQKWGLKATIGIGSVKRGLHEVYKSSEEAAKCLQFLKTYQTDLRYVSYTELGGNRLLLQNSADDLIAYVLDVLGPLLSYEKARKREFLLTLSAYLDNSLKMKETAQSLNIHLNTLIYRIKRTEDILGFSLTDHKHFMDVCMAIHVYQLLEVQIEQRLAQRRAESKSYS